MKTIGLIGGMSWESTVPYYRIINETVRNKLGGLHSAKVVLYSVDFYEIELLQRSGDWDEAGRVLAQAAESLQAAGADFLVLCTNTMHKVADLIESAVRIPLFHIADATAQEIKKAGLTQVGLLGTRFTMVEDFYRGRLRDPHQLKVLIPDDADQGVVHRVIYEELVLGLVRDSSRTKYRKIIQRLVNHGAQGVILGCTEISMLVGPADSPVPLFDTTGIHARKAAEYSLGK
jgi:aspartate racemase